METKYGIIANCRMADIKAEPRLGAETSFTVTVGTKLAIDSSDTATGYYKVFFANGTNGYVVRRFVQVIR